MADDNQINEIIAKLDSGVRALFESDRYAEYLNVMSRFHGYSKHNISLILAQNPNAHHIASRDSWKNNFNREVKKGERGIKILAPVPFAETREFVKLDTNTRHPIIDADGNPVMETLTKRGIKLKNVVVYDIAQTYGEPLLELIVPLTGNVEQYELFMDTLRAVSPLPIRFEKLPPDTDGFCYFNDRIAIREGMSELQTISSIIHEIAHIKISGESTNAKHAEEVICESISYVVCQKFGIETGTNAFSYVGVWSKTRKMKELHDSVDIIRKTAAELIDDIEENYKMLAKKRGIDLTPAPRKETLTMNETDTQNPAEQLTELQQKAINYAKNRASLSLQSRLNIIAKGFNCNTATIEKRLCTGKWRGFTDVSIRFDNGASLGIGTKRTSETKKKSVIDEFVNDTLAYYNPDIIAETKSIAAAALLKREAADNAVAAEKGLLPYKFLNAELNDGSVNASGDYIGWYFVTLEIGGRIVNHVETGLNYDIAGGKVSELAKPKNYFVAGGLKDKDADFVFDGVGHCSTKDHYSLESSADVTKRAHETLEKRNKEEKTPMQSDNFTPDDKDFWRGQIVNFLTSNNGEMKLEDLELPPTDGFGGLSKFYKVFGENGYEQSFADIVAQENTRRTGKPWVVFNFCEGGDYRPDCLKKPTAMRFSEADAFIRQYEPKIREMLQAQGGGYDKLDYTVYIKRDDNIIEPTRDRYDIGDNKNASGLYNVLKAGTDFYYTHPEIYDWKPTDDNFEENKKRDYADMATLKAAVAPEYPYVEIEKVTRYADGDKLDQKIFNQGEILSFAEADSKIKTTEKAIRDKNMQKYGSPGDGDEELGIAVHFKLPGESEPRVHRVSYLLGDYDEERSGLLKHFEMGAEYFNLCVKNGDYGNVNAILNDGSPADIKNADDAIRLAADYNEIYKALYSSMNEPAIMKENREPVGYLCFSDSGEVVEYYSADKMLAAYKSEMDSVGAENVRYNGVTDENLEKKLYAAYAGEYGEDVSAKSVILPDPTVTIAEMNEFGYTAAELLPLSQERAMELFNSGNPVYLLYPDNTEAMVLDIDEIKVHDGMYGIEVADWERIQAAEMQKTNENIDEEQPTYYQIDNSSNTLRESEENTAPTVAELEAEVKAGKSISLMDLAKAVNAEPKRPPAKKSKPDFLAKIEANKRRVAQDSQSNPQKDKQPEV